MESDASERIHRRFFTLAQVAATLSLTADDVEAMLVSSEILAIRVGPHDEWRIEQQQLDAYIEAKYEESRRAALWRGFDFGGVRDLDLS